jgi:hypothetical protein
MWRAPTEAASESTTYSSFEELRPELVEFARLKAMMFVCVDPYKSSEGHRRLRCEEEAFSR